jgi:opacity protein-like surface antigen
MTPLSLRAVSAVLPCGCVVEIGVTATMHSTLHAAEQQCEIAVRHNFLFQPATFQELRMKIFRLSSAAVLSAGLALSSAARADDRGVGWEFGMDVIYQGSKDVDFDGGSKVSLDSDFGLSVNGTYRFSDKLELVLALDWQNADYDATLNTFTNTTPPVPTGSVGVKGTLESFTPRVAVNYNFMSGPVTPYVNAGIGYSFMDTNIPNGRPENVCWWDPWWGYVCGSVQDTKNVDSFTYQLGAGVRWDIGPAYSIRFAYEAHWFDIPKADSAPVLNQFKVGFIYRY